MPSGHAFVTADAHASSADAVAHRLAGIDPGAERDPEISDLIKRLHALTPQQTRVLGKLAEGLLNKQIAYECSVTEATIKAHVSAILQKLDVDSRTQAVVLLSRIGGDPLRAGG